MKRREFITLLASVVVSLSVVVPKSDAVAADDPGAFILDIANRAMTALTDPGIPNNIRAERFRSLLQEGMDIPHVAERVLGPYVRRATPAEMTEFEQLLEENIVRKYAILFKGYSSEAIEVLETKDGRRDTSLVKVQVRQKDGSPPIVLDWIVHKVGGAYKVIDIIIERASMVTTQREEFVSVIRRGGGKISSLLDEMRERNAELAANVTG